MGTSVIPVDLLNPGQVFACLGFLEAADLLYGPAEGGFAWDGETAKLCSVEKWAELALPAFVLTSPSSDNPVEEVLRFLASAEVRRLAPLGWKPSKKDADQDDEESEDETAAMEEDPSDLDRVSEFCAKKAEKMALPIALCRDNTPPIVLAHWADESGRDTFKLYAGNRSAAEIAAHMLRGRWTKAKKPKLEAKGVRQLWQDQRATLVDDPFGVLCALRGRFNFDPRGAWTAIDAGYSPDKQKPKQKVVGSPVVEILAAWGLENARPTTSEDGNVRYGVWGCRIAPMLARAALAADIPGISSRRFSFVLGQSGKNKYVTFAQPLQERPR